MFQKNSVDLGIRGLVVSVCLIYVYALIDCTNKKVEVVDSETS